MMTSLDSGFFFARTIKEDPRYAGIPVIIATSVSSALGLDFGPRSDERPAPDARRRLLRQTARPCHAARHDRRAAGGRGGWPGVSAGRRRPGSGGSTDAHLGQPPHHHRHRQVPHVLRLRARVPGQGHPGGGRAGQVIQPRCIGCGNCLRVCTQNAKQVRDDTERTFGLWSPATRWRRSWPPASPPSSPTSPRAPWWP